METKKTFKGVITQLTLPYQFYGPSVYMFFSLLCSNSDSDY